MDADENWPAEIIICIYVFSWVLFFDPSHIENNILLKKNRNLHSQTGGQSSPGHKARHAILILIHIWRFVNTNYKIVLYLYVRFEINFIFGGNFGVFFSDLFVIMVN